MCVALTGEWDFGRQPVPREAETWHANRGERVRVNEPHEPVWERTVARVRLTEYVAGSADHRRRFVEHKGLPAVQNLERIVSRDTLRELTHNGVRVGAGRMQQSSGSGDSPGITLTVVPPPTIVGEMESFISARKPRVGDSSFTRWFRMRSDWSRLETFLNTAFWEKPATPAILSRRSRTRSCTPGGGWLFSHALDEVGEPVDSAVHVRQRAVGRAPWVVSRSQTNPFSAT